MNVGRQTSIVSSLQLGCIIIPPISFCIVWVNIWGGGGCSVQNLNFYIFDYIFNIRKNCRLLSFDNPSYYNECLHATCMYLIVHACIAMSTQQSKENPWPYMYIYSYMYIVIDINNRKSCYYATIYFFHFFTHYFSQVTITLITTPVHELNDFFLQVIQK